MAESRLQRWRREARALFADVGLLARAIFDPEAPWPARVVVFLVVAYVLSPVDLIPDFIPVLGLLDELVLVPLALRFALRLMPPALLERYRAAPQESTPSLAMKIYGATMVIVIWLALIVLAAMVVHDTMRAE